MVMCGMELNELIKLTKKCSNPELTNCNECPYKALRNENTDCLDYIMMDLADAIEQLLRERDALLADLKKLADCDYCKYGKGDYCEDTLHDGCISGEYWEWRGVKDASQSQQD